MPHAASCDLLATVRAAVRIAADAEGLSAVLAARMAERIEAHIRRAHAAERLYVPAPDRSARDRAILAGAAAGDTHAAIAQRVGCSVATVARVIGRKRRRRDGFAPEGWGL